MHHEYKDWKDVANNFYSKSLSLTLLFMLFAFLVSPKLEVKQYERKEVQITQVEDIPPEIREQIKPPEVQMQPEIEIIIEDTGNEDDEDIPIAATIGVTTIDPDEILAAPPANDAKTDYFVVFDEAPVAIKRVMAVYPEMAKRLGIEGAVHLRVEVLRDGSVRHIEILKSLQAGPNGLDEAAKIAVKQWKFKPAQSGGNPVACWVTFPYEFVLEN